MKAVVAFAVGIVVALGAVYAVSRGPEAKVAQADPQREVYYPGTEKLRKDEMRVVACGTGMPSVRPKQAAACWLVELGNGDKFLFDIGAQSMSRISAMKIPMDSLDKVFIGHLHTDHMGDLPILWTGSLKMNRTVPLRVWGPSGETPEMGTKAAIEGLQEFLHWDDESLRGRLDARAMVWEVNEFDFKGVNEVIYDENGVTIRSIPAIHSLDGSVSYILEWNGLKFAYSSDTSPNNVVDGVRQGSRHRDSRVFRPRRSADQQSRTTSRPSHSGSRRWHTRTPAQFGKIMAETKPRMAVGYHFYNDHDTLPIVLEAVRTTYDGPLALATDYMVFNVTPDDVRVRMAVDRRGRLAAPAGSGDGRRREPTPELRRVHQIRRMDDA